MKAARSVRVTDCGRRDLEAGRQTDRASDDEKPLPQQRQLAS